MGKMTSSFNVRNLTSGAADGTSLATRETLIARTANTNEPKS
jgi:hypothetical protein